LGGILGISSQTIVTILALWIPCLWERVAGSFSNKKIWILGLKHTTPKYSQNKILAVKNLEKSLGTSVFGDAAHKNFKKRASKVAHNRPKPFYFTLQPRPQPTAQNLFNILWNLGTKHLFSYLCFQGFKISNQSCSKIKDLNDISFQNVPFSQGGLL
jgi:hypothetical protein